MKKTLLVVLTSLSLVFGGITLQGCLKSGDNGELVVEVPHAAQFGQIANALAQVARTTYLGENAPAVESVLRDIIRVVGVESNGKINLLILSTVDEAVNAGKLDGSYKLFFIGVLGVIENYYTFSDYDIAGVILILEQTANGLQDQIGVSEVKGFSF